MRYSFVFALNDVLSPVQRTHAHSCHVRSDLPRHLSSPDQLMEREKSKNTAKTPSETLTLAAEPIDFADARACFVAVWNGESDTPVDIWEDG